MKLRKRDPVEIFVYSIAQVKGFSVDMETPLQRLETSAVEIGGIDPEKINEVVTHMREMLHRLLLSELKQELYAPYFIVNEARTGLRVSWRAGYDGEMIQAMHELMDVYSHCFQAGDPENIFPAVRGEMYKNGSLPDDWLSSPDQFFSIFAEPVRASAERQLRADPELARTIGGRMRLLKNHTMQPDELIDDDFKKIAKVMQSGMKNPIQIFFYLYFLQQSLASHGFEIDFNAAYKDIFLTLSSELFGVKEDAFLSRVDYSGAFLTAQGLAAIQQRKELLARQASRPRCPALTKEVFLQVKDFIFQALDFMVANSQEFFDEVANAPNPESADELCAHFEFLGGRLIEFNGGAQNFVLSGNPYLRMKNLN